MESGSVAMDACEQEKIPAEQTIQTRFIETTKTR
jgi:hypothetical protein